MRNPFVALAALALFVGAAAAVADAAPVLNAAIAPNARSGAANAPLTVFASITNSGDATASGCVVQTRVGSLGVAWRTLNPDNTIDGGTPNTAFSVAAGQTQALLLTFTTSIAAADQPIDFICGSSRSTSYLGTNTVSILPLGAGTPDIIPIVVTPSGDGVIRIGSVGGTGFMAAAAINIGGAGDLLVRPSFWPSGQYAPVDGSALMPLAPMTLSICETGAGGACLAPPTTNGLQVNFASSQTRTFTVFADVDDGAGLPFMPDINRVFLSFTRTDANNTAAGLSSAAIVAPGPSGLTSPAGVYDIRERVNGSTDDNLSTTAWNMIMMIAPNGKMLAFGGVPGGSSSRRPFDTIYTLALLSGDLNLADTGNGFSFTSSNAVASAVFGNTGGSTITPMSSFTGNIQPGLQITGASVGPNTAGPYAPLTFRGVSVPQIYDRPKTLADLVGAYSLGTISANGAVQGSISSCAYTGAFTQPTAGKNLFAFTFTFSNCGANTLSNKTMTGLMTIPSEVTWNSAIVQDPLVMVQMIGDRLYGYATWVKQ